MSKFDPNPDRGGRERDFAWPSQIAAQRPALTTRIHCVPDSDERDPRRTLRGTPPPEPEYIEEEFGMEDRIARFNRQLRGGHGEGEK